jgi:cell division protein FtsB/cell division protein DivIC
MEIIKRPIHLIIIIFLLFIVFLPSYIKLQDLKQKNRDLEEKIKEIERENLVLREERENLKNNPFYIEKVGREKMGVVKKGEIIYKILSEEE